MLLIQADGRHDLESPIGWNEGDAGDPFPGSRRRRVLKDRGTISTSFPNQAPSGIKLERIRRDSASGRITLDVVFANQSHAAPASPPGHESPRTKGYPA